MSGTNSWHQGMIAVEVDAGIATVTLNRPDKLNAMDRAFWGDLRDAIDWAGKHQAVRCLVLRGAGGRAFSAGGDVASFADLVSDAQRHAFQVDAMATFEAVATCARPTIAAVQGYALGGGCELAMACDIVIAAEGAVFGLPEARFGLVPGYGVLRAPIVAGAQLAKLMIFAGERLTADEALRHGLVQKLCAADRFEGEVARIAAAIAAAPPEAIAAAKALIDAALDPERIRASIDAVTRLHATEDARRGVSGFLGAQA